jgi:hypothetical protein
MSKQSQYAVCHLQKAKGNDSGMSCHIERKDANGKQYVPENTDKSRAHLNRELIKFPAGVTCRTEAIMHRIKAAGVKRKISAKQNSVIRIVLTGSHDRMNEIEKSGKLNAWIDANLDWLKRTFGEENLVSCVLHMDEKTPHLHASVVPIVTEERKRREREGEKKYQKKSGPRLAATELTERHKLREYQESYGNAMAQFGLERGVIGSPDHHKTSQQYNAQMIREQQQEIESLQENIEVLQALTDQIKRDAKDNVKAKVMSWLSTGDLTKARKEIEAKDREIATLQGKLNAAEQELDKMKAGYEKQLADAKNAYQREIDAAIARAEAAEKKCAAQRETINRLDRKVNPHRYQLSSGAELSDMRFFSPNSYTYTLKIWTKVGEIEHNAVAYLSDNDSRLTAYRKGDLTAHELVNELFPSDEQVNAEQSHLLESTIELLSGGPAQAHVGTGGGGSTASDSRWDGKTRDDFRPKRR